MVIFFALNGKDKSIRFWDLKSIKWINVIEAHKFSEINDISLFSKNNDFNLLGALEHEDKVVSAKWHPDIPIIISTSADKSARVWIPQNY